MQPLMRDQVLQLELLQVVPHGVERQPQPARQILGSQLSASLELKQHGPTLTALAQREVWIDEGKSTAHTGMLRSGTWLVNSFQTIGANVYRWILQ
jgi:hypothetical protein